jgi:low affinity Fe/Cu permease
MKKQEKKGSSIFEKFASKVTKATGSTPAFLGAFGIVLVWALSGPFFDYSETWQLVINTGTTIITFLMVFLIQKAQNKDSMAIQLKLNELVASHEFASNRLVDVEDLSEAEMKVLQQYYILLSALSKKEDSLQHSHSIDEAKETHEIKKGNKQKRKKLS